MNKFRVWDAYCRYFFYFGPDFSVDDEANTITFPCDRAILGDRGGSEGEGRFKISSSPTGRCDKNSKGNLRGRCRYWFDDGETLIVEYNLDLTWESGGSPHPGFYFRGFKELEYGVGFDSCVIIGNIYENPELLK
jgi:hypothetical protein